MQENYKKLVGKPWLFNGRDPNVGLDCIGLLSAFYKEHNWEPTFNDGKTIEDDWFLKDKYRMLRYFVKNFDKTFDIDSLTYGDILMFEINGEAHVGIYLEYGKFLTTFPPKEHCASYSFIDRLTYWGQFFIYGFKRRVGDQP